MFNDTAASYCPFGTLSIAPLTTSDPYAPKHNPSAITAAEVGASEMPSAGKAKYSQNICTTTDVPRKTSTYTTAQVRTSLTLDSRAVPATTDMITATHAES